jgi:hypothetical protein
LPAVKTRGSALVAVSATAAVLASPVLGAHATGADTYVVTVTGSQQSVVVRAGSIRNDLGCTFAVKDSDRQALAFTAKRRVRLTLRATKPLPTIGFVTRVAVAGLAHRESQVTDGDPDVCGTSKPPRTTRCGPRAVPARLRFHPAGRRRVVLDGSFVGDGERLACETTLTTPDRFLVPAQSRLRLPPGGVRRLFAKGRLHLTTKQGDVTKTTDVRWTVVLKRVP